MRPQSVTAAPVPLAALPAVFPRPTVSRAIEAEGAADLRRRSLPAPLVVYLNLALWAHPSLGYTEVLDLLLTALPPRTRAGWRRATSTSITQARRRLGPAVMRRLFHDTAGGPREAAPGLVAVETAFAVPDSPDNRAAFGGPSVTRRPRVRVAALVCPLTCSIHAAVWSPWPATPRLAGGTDPRGRPVGAAVRSASGSLGVWWPGGSGEASGFRSRDAAGVIAEVWALLCLHQAAVALGGSVHSAAAGGPEGLDDDGAAGPAAVADQVGADGLAGAGLAGDVGDAGVGR